MMFFLFDFYGGEWFGVNWYVNFVVVLRVSIGEFIWVYQIVQYDFWDYDLVLQLLLVDVEIDGVMCVVVVQVMKMGFVFVFDCEMGEFFYEVDERLVFVLDIDGEEVYLMQRFLKI